MGDARRQKAQVNWEPSGAEILKVRLLSIWVWDFPHGPVVKNLPCNGGDMDLIPSQGTKEKRASEDEVAGQHEAAGARHFPAGSWLPYLKNDRVVSSSPG